MIAEFVPDNEPCPALPSITRLAADANYHRCRNRPQHLQDLDFQLNMDHIPDNFLRWDIRVEGARHLLFASDAQLDLMSNATFHVMRQPFYQLFTVNAFVRHEGCTKQLPMVMCMMSRRRKTDYIAGCLSSNVCHASPLPGRVHSA